MSDRREGHRTYATGNLEYYRVNSSTGTVDLSRLTVTSLYDLQNPEEGYDVARALSPENPNNDKWWMPFGRTSYEHTVGACQSAFWEDEVEKLRACKARFVDDVYGEPFGEPIDFPYEEDCRLLPVHGVRDQPAIKALQLGDPYRYRIRSLPLTGTYLRVHHGTLEAGQLENYPNSGTWRLEKGGRWNQAYVLLNDKTGNVLCHETDVQSEQLGVCSPSTEKPHHWLVDFSPQATPSDASPGDPLPPETGRVYRIRSRVDPDRFLFLDGGSLRFASPNSSSPDSQWFLQPMNCNDSCGGQAPGGCWCDESCTALGDCCGDKTISCDLPAEPKDAPLCQGACGQRAATGCWCDESCVDYGDCCFDYETTCAGTCFE